MDRGRNQVLSKSMTLGELTDSIIAKDYGPNPFMLRQPPFAPYRNPESISTTEHWNYNRRLQQQQKDSQQSAQPPSQSVQHHTVKTSGAGRATPDDRHIIRMAQSPSPHSRNKPMHESITPPSNYHQYPPAPLGQNVNRLPPTSASGPQFALDCYVKNRIAEAMRTEDEKRADDAQQRRTPQQPLHPSSSAHHNKDVDRSNTPAEMVTDEDAPPTSTPSSSTSNTDHHSHHPSHPPHPALINSAYPPPAVSTYTYPFSALNVSAAASSLPPPLKSSIDVEPNNRPPPSIPAAEPKPLLSAQYEALSDED